MKDLFLRFFSLLVESIVPKWKRNRVVVVFAASLMRKVYLFHIVLSVQLKAGELVKVELLTSFFHPFHGLMFWIIVSQFGWLI